MNVIVMGLTLAMVSITGCQTSGADTDPDEPVDAGFAVDAGPDAASQWQILTESDPHGLLLSAWGVIPGEMYFAGGQVDATAIAHFDGTELTWMENPGEALAWWIVGIGKSTFVVGEGGLGLHRAGDGPWELWDTGVTQGTLFGLWGSAADDLWVVGGDVQRGGPPILRHWDGDVWTDAELPDLGEATPVVFFKVWGTAQDDVYVVGDQGVTLHFNGERWRLMRAANTDALLTVHGNGDALWAVGGRAAGSVWRQGEDGWVNEALGPLPGIAGVFVHRDQTVLISGFNGLLMKRDAEGKWHSGPRLTTEVLHSVWKTPAGAIFATGGSLQRYPDTTEGVILYHPAPQ